MKRCLFILLFVALSLGFVSVVDAVDDVGTSCEKGNRKKLCQGNTVVTLECPYTCHYQEDKDRCNKAEYACSNKCDQERDSCICKVNPALGAHLQGTIADRAYMNCSDNCHDTLYRCYSSCGSKHSQCVVEAKEADETCLKTLTWIKTDEEACQGTLVCFDRPSGAVCTVAKYAAPAPASTYEKCNYEEHNQQFAVCVDACGTINASNITGYDKFRVCMHSCGDISLECETIPVPASSPEEVDNCILRVAQEFWDSQAYVDAQLECSRQKGILPDELDVCLHKNQEFVAREEVSMRQAENCVPSGTETPSSGNEDNRQQGVELSFNTVVLGKNGGVDMSISEIEWNDAREKLEKIKEKDDSQWTDKKNFAKDYNAELARTLDHLALDQETKDQTVDKLEFVRGTLDDIHDIASHGVGWEEFPETVESIKKGETGKYGKLDLATDAVKSFNDYHEERAKGRTVEVAATKATLDNFGSTALTTIPVLKAIDLVVTTPDMVLDIFGIDKDNWSRKYVTAGAIGKFAPSGVVKQTTDLMVDNRLSDIGNALSYQWGKVKSANGVLDTAHESSKLFFGAVGAAPVALARGFSDTLGATIFVGQGALNFADRLFR